MEQVATTSFSPFLLSSRRGWGCGMRYGYDTMPSDHNRENVANGPQPCCHRCHLRRLKRFSIPPHPQSAQTLPYPQREQRCHSHKLHNPYPDHKPPISTRERYVYSVDTMIVQQLCRRGTGTNIRNRQDRSPNVVWEGVVLTSSRSFVASCNIRTSSCTSKLNNGPDFPLALLTIKS